VTEPVIATHTDAAVLTQIHAAAGAALQRLGLDAAALVAHDTHHMSALPIQALQHPIAPAFAVRRAAATAARILVLVQSFPMGGYTAFNADLLPRLAARGHVITTCMTEVWHSDWRLDQVRAVSPDIHHAHAVVPAPAVAAYIDWLITSRAVEVVLLSHSYLGYHLLPWLRARHPGVAFVDYVHTDWFEAGMYGSYATMAARWESQLDAQLATSHALVAQLVAGGCAPEAVRAAHIGVDTTVWQHTGQRLADVRQSFGATRDTVVLLFAGRVSPEKRPLLAIDVLARLLTEGTDARLVIAGGGPLLRACADHATARGVASSVHILGELDEHTLRHVYASADVFLALGCVPVVSDVGGQRELVVPGTGSLVDASRNDAAPYLEGVRPFLDRTVRAQAAAAARAHITSHFDSARTVQTVCETLALARMRRVARQAVVPAAIAEELAVMGLDVLRRHMIQATTPRQADGSPSDGNVCRSR
jgi:glycosyltransferase involved in cell wall biosynthesis